MSTYIIGDVQGCFDSLQALLQKIHFNPTVDQLGFVGDLVNRGPKSLETLRFMMQLNNPLIVLGNHDLHLLALYFLRDHFAHIPHTMEAVLDAPDCNALIHFLLRQPLMIAKKNCVMVHAGIAPQWSIKSALSYANETTEIMRQNPTLFFEHIYGNNPTAWHENLIGWDRVRYIVNAFTRMRFCTKDGELELTNKTDMSADQEYRPWFEWSDVSTDIYFGHWASLNGHCAHPRIFALDTGCAWGGSLTAMRVEDKTIFSVESREKI